MNILKSKLLRTFSLAACLGAGLSAVYATEQTTGQIQVTPDGHFLREANGEPFFWLGDTAWELFYRLDRAETEQYLQDRAQKGFNVIQAVATGQLDFQGLRRPNRFGEPPFIDADPLRPNPHYFEHIDWVVERANHYGIRIALLPTWGAYFINGSSAQVFDAANAEVYGRWLGQRYRDKNIIWVLGGDITPVSWKSWKRVKTKDGEPLRWEFDKTIVDYRPVYDAMAKGIAAGEGGKPFITYHPTAGSPSGAAPARTSLYFADRDWLSMNMLQSSHGRWGDGRQGGGSYQPDGSFRWNAVFNYVPVADEYASFPARPVVDAEPRYEDHPLLLDVDKKAGQYWRAHDIRQAAYQAVFSGAAGHTYGHFSIWNLNDPKRKAEVPSIWDSLFEGYVWAPWQQALNAPGAMQMQYVKNLMVSRPYFSRIPDQGIIVGNPGEGESHIAATRDKNGAYAMVYLPQGQSVTVDLSRISGSSVRSWWFNPRDGQPQRIEGERPAHGAHRFTPPTMGTDQDWVLVLEDASKEFSPPGVPRIHR